MQHNGPNLFGALTELRGIFDASYGNEYRNIGLPG